MMNKTYLENRQKIKEKNLKYDFLPSMLEIIEKPENKVSNIIIWLVLALIVTAVVWAALAKTDISVTAQGSVVPKDNLFSVMSVTGGEVTEIAVEDGQRVNEGDLLFAFDSTNEEETLKLLDYEISVLEKQKQTYEELMLDVEERLGEEQKDLSIEAERISILQNIDSLEVQIKELDFKKKEVNQSIDKKRIVATTSGILTNSSVQAKGQLISAGDNLAYIIPDDAELIFKAYVKSSDIEGLKPGDTVSVRIAALKDTPYDRMEGSVQRIGDVAVNIEGLGSVYRVDISLPELPKDNLKIGQEGNCDVIIGQRTVLSYFIEPFIKGLNESMHEK